MPTPIEVRKAHMQSIREQDKRNAQAEKEAAARQAAVEKELEERDANRLAESEAAAKAAETTTRSTKNAGGPTQNKASK